MTDITKAINCASFDVDEVWRVSRLINLPCTSWRSTEMETVPQIIHIDRDLKIEELNPRKSTARVGICGAHGLSLNSVWVYCDQNVPLTIIHLNNPQYGAVNGMKFSFDNDLNQNYYITSGQLSGCTFAVLFKENNVYFAHAGKDSGTHDQQSGDYNNKCIYNVICALGNERVTITTDSMKTDCLVNWLTTNGYIGIIAKILPAGRHAPKAEITSKAIHICEYASIGYVTSIISRKRFLNAYFTDGLSTAELQQNVQYIWGIG